ncbi:MAG: ROK family protein [Clostridia bacterium]|nr:ROK family protein [Clostridia bacterium]
MEYCIGVDLGGTNIAAGVVDLKTRRIVAKGSVKTRAPRPSAEIAEDIVALCHSIAKEAGATLASMKWIGVATPGIVKDGVVISANNLRWTNANLANDVQSRAGVRTYVANDANVAAYAEALWGSGEHKASLVAITLGTCVGGGIVIDSKIWEGKNGFAAEMGHTIVDAGGRECTCGKRGCLEAYASATALIGETRRMMSLYGDSIMWSMVDGDITKVSGTTAFRAAAKGDRAAQRVIDDFIRHLAIGVSNVINILQPDVVCIGGGISGEGDNLILPLRREIERISFGTDGNRTEVVAAKFRNDAGIIGSALLGKQDEVAKMNAELQSIVDNFATGGKVVYSEPYGSGHINDTRYVIVERDGERREYILQRINDNVFKDPVSLMDNYVAVTEYLRKIITERGGDPDRETLNAIKTLDGKSCYKDAEGKYWRLVLFVTDSESYDKVERPEQFYESAVAFGNFQYLLRDYPADTLNETIVNFHNTPDRYRQLMEAVAGDKCGRLSEVESEVEFAKARREFAYTLERAREEGRLPLKVTHNDTKLNNILFDKKSGKPLCVIDLDTIMPGYSVNDFGDSIRFGATTALEDEIDLSKVNFDINLYELYVKGFIEGAKGGLTEGELELLPIGAIMMTFECGMRFLTDYLSGDTYFRTSRPRHNLDRARNQFKLVSDMEKSLPEMHAIVKKYSAK